MNELFDLRSILQDSKHQKVVKKEEANNI